jgi:hypothetical protein
VTSPRLRTRRSQRRVVVLAAGAAVAAAALTGCSATNPMTTETPYSASDGVRAQIGDVRASNLILVSEAHGKPGVLTGALTNDGDKDTTVSITIGETAPTSVDVASHQTVLLLGEDTQGQADVRTPAADTAPGGLTDVTLATPTDGSYTVRVPVLDGTLEEYAAFLPTASPSS